MKFLRSGNLHAGVVLLTFAVAACSGNEPKWASTNKQIINQSKVTGRTRELPRVSVPMLLGDGEPVDAAKLPEVMIASGVTAKLAWGHGALLERVEMAPGAV